MVLRRHAKPIKNHAASAYPQTLGQRNGIGARQKRFRSRLKKRAGNLDDAVDVLNKPAQEKRDWRDQLE
jgi:hypothetical protein